MKFPILARWFSAILLGLFACICFGQSKFYGSVKQEATIIVRRPQIGSDLIDITYQGADYPEVAIEKMLDRLGKALGNQPRDLTVSRDGAVVKASFAADGIVTDGNPRVNLAALAKAMAFGDRPIRSFSVFFDNMSADVNTPKKWFPENNSWKMEGVTMSAPKGIDYRVQVITNDPNEIYMPNEKDRAASSGKPVPSERPNGFILGGIVLGAIAIGVLVYSALLRPRSKGR